jgi:two-component system, OmpR family, sensor kinase
VSRLPARVRLTLVFALVAAVVLAGCGALVYVRVANDLEQSLDQSLRARAQDVSALVRRGGSLRTTPGPLVEQGETFAEVLDARGRVVDSTPPIGKLRLLDTATVAQARTGPMFTERASVPGLDERARLLAVPVGGVRKVLVVGATKENRAETLSSLLRAFLIGGPLALLLASAGAYVLAGAALRPIERMRRRADEISTSSLDERLPVPPASDELRRLGETLNEMLAGLEAGLERERRFVADASHELRTPLALLRTELEVALRQTRSQAELEQTVQAAVAEVDRLTMLADDLLLLARSDRGALPLQIEQVDVLDLLESVARRFQARAKASGRGVEIEGDSGLVVRADRLRLQQAVDNLVDNALRHGGGTVRLATHEANGQVEVHVSDSGPGVPSAFFARAFERFSRADEARSGNGTGLGLSIVRAIAERHGGSAQLQNLPTGGADVWLSLPR